MNHPWKPTITRDRQPEPEDALCRQVDPELWWPELGGSAKQAKEICRQCPLVQACLRAALDRREFEGVWGATSPNERRAMLGLKAKGVKPPKEPRTACDKGHDLTDPANRYLNQGYLRCRPCHREKQLEYRKRKAA